MDKKNADNEISYQVIKIVLTSLLSEELITEAEFEEAKKALIKKLNPIIGGLE